MFAWKCAAETAVTVYGFSINRYINLFNSARILISKPGSERRLVDWDSVGGSAAALHSGLSTARGCGLGVVW